jgi:hypothetical protein
MKLKVLMILGLLTLATCTTKDNSMSKSPGIDENAGAAVGGPQAGSTPLPSATP